MLRELFAFPGVQMQQNIVQLHEEVINECIDRLRPLHDNLAALSNDKDFYNKITQDTNRACRVLRFIMEYIMQYDRDFAAERKSPSLSRWARDFVCRKRGG